MNASDTHPGWLASLDVHITRSGPKSRIEQRQHRGPLMIQRPFYPEGEDRCHVYLLHPPGGIVGGDRLNVSLTLGAHTHALISQPSASKFYRSSGADSLSRQTIRLDKNAQCEWLPLETIAFRGARARMTTEIDLHRSAACIAWEVLCLGRPAANERFDDGWIEQRWRVHRDGQPILLDRLAIDGGGELQQSPWGLATKPVYAHLIATPIDADTAQSISAQMPRSPHARTTWRNGILHLRYLGDFTDEAHRYCRAAWRWLRPVIMGCPANEPRLWQT